MKHLEKVSRRHRIGAVGWFALVLGVLVMTALLIFRSFLADYQSNLPKNFADQIFTAYQSGDVKTIREYSANLPEALEAPTLFSDYYAKNTDLENLYFYAGASDDPNKLCYEFVSGNLSVATLILHKTEHISRFGFPQYEIASLTGHPLINYTITAPADTVLFVNGKLLSERFRTDLHSRIDNFAPLPNTAFQTKTYEITDFTYIEDLGAFSGDGSECAVAWSADHRTATVTKQMSKEQQDEIFEFATTFSKAYSVFATKRGGARNPVLQLLYPGTPFYSALLLYENSWGEVYASDSFKEPVIDCFKAYSPTEFSCDIRFDYVIRLSDGFEKTYPYNMTYYLTNRSGRLLLVDMQAKS